MKKLPFLLLNLVAALLIIWGIVVYVLHELDDYTQHGSFISVPAFNDMTLQEASEVAAHNHLRIQVIDSIYSENAKPGTVIEQYPAGGSSVKENRLIHLTINAQAPEKIALPNLQNAAYRQTLQTLEAKGFRIGRIEYAPSEFRNLVLQLKNKGEETLPGTLLTKGSEIDIVLGSGEGSNLINVPLFAGKQLREAIELIRKSYMNLGEVIPDETVTKSADKLSAFVYQQTPAFNDPVEAGCAVDLYITLQKEKLAALDSLIVEE